MALVAMAQNQASKPSTQLTKTSEDSSKQGNKKKSTPEPEVPLTYSKDESTMFGDSTLMGQHYATDNSTSTRETKENSAGYPLPKYATENKDASTEKETEDDSFLSIQQSSSSMTEVIPSDEELFRIGWAKAMDPGSGSYYYFTLDRSTIVWENPLYKHGDGDSASERSSPIPGGFHI